MFGEFWPEPQGNAAIQGAADYNWRLLEDMGGGMVATIRRKIDKHDRAGKEAAARGDRDAEAFHDEAVDALFEQLETLLAYTGGAR